MLDSSIAGQVSTDISTISNDVRPPKSTRQSGDIPRWLPMLGSEADDPLEVVPLPHELYLESTNRCNELCDQCPRTHLKREPDRDLSLAEVIAITDQLPVLERVVLHGLGEPMLNPELPAIVAHLRGRGAYVLFNSNATALG